MSERPALPPECLPSENHTKGGIPPQVTPHKEGERLGKACTFFVQRERRVRQDGRIHKDFQRVGSVCTCPDDSPPKSVSRVVWTRGSAWGLMLYKGVGRVNATRPAVIRRVAFATSVDAARRANETPRAAPGTPLYLTIEDTVTLYTGLYSTLVTACNRSGVNMGGKMRGGSACSPQCVVDCWPDRLER